MAGPVDGVGAGSGLTAGGVVCVSGAGVCVWALAASAAALETTAAAPIKRRRVSIVMRQSPYVVAARRDNPLPAQRLRRTGAGTVERRRGPAPPRERHSAAIFPPADRPKATLAQRMTPGCMASVRVGSVELPCCWHRARAANVRWLAGVSAPGPRWSRRIRLGARRSPVFRKQETSKRRHPTRDSQLETANWRQPTRDMMGFPRRYRRHRRGRRLGASAPDAKPTREVGHGAPGRPLPGGGGDGGELLTYKDIFICLWS